MNDFPKDFVFGAATSAYQIEGGWNEDGRSPSVWDFMCHNYEQIGGSGDVACDHYHLWEEDIALMKEMGLQAYRFSISWNRILPDESGEINQAGIDFYNNIINELLAKNIIPYVTLYHFDLPMYLEEKGGWLNRETIEAFEKYSAICFEAFGDRVTNWSTINEPYIVANMYAMRAKYGGGGSAIEYALTASHHLNLGHTASVATYRKSTYNTGKIGIVPNLSMVYGELPKEKLDFADALYNRFYMEPAFKGSYPKEVLKFIKDNNINVPILEGDDEIFASVKTDFIGVNNYSRLVLDPSIDFMNFSAETFANTTTMDTSLSNVTEYGWEVYPEGIYEVMLHISKLYDYPELIVTENGAAYKDNIIKEGMVMDDDRIAYLDSYLQACKKAIDEGIKLTGYFVWTFMDNFEWSSSYKIKMGLVHVDFETQKRTIKKSGLWYQNFIKEYKESCKKEKE